MVSVRSSQRLYHTAYIQSRGEMVSTLWLSANRLYARSPLSVYSCAMLFQIENVRRELNGVDALTRVGTCRDTGRKIIIILRLCKSGDCQKHRSLG